MAKAGLIQTDNANYFFYLCYYSNLICNMGIPLYTVYAANKVNTKVCFINIIPTLYIKIIIIKNFLINTLQFQKASKEEFVKLLFDKNFLILLKVNYCLFIIKTIIFF